MLELTRSQAQPCDEMLSLVRILSSFVPNSCFKFKGNKVFINLIYLDFFETPEPKGGILPPPPPPPPHSPLHNVKSNKATRMNLEGEDK